MGASGDGVTREGMDELGRRFDAAKPDVTIVFTPHNVHVEESFAVGPRDLGSVGPASMSRRSYTAA